VNTDEVRALAARLLAEELPQRWRHVQAVGSRAEAVAPLVGDWDDVLVRAAWLHDIGYAPELAVTGFHPLDGALYLDSIGAPRRIVCLVAHHSCAREEAQLRGLGAQLAQFDDEAGALRDALWCCDITTSPDGERVKAAKRIREIKRRYGLGNVVTRAITNSTPELLGAVQRTEQLVAHYQGPWPR
jgi:hypothetical protein